MGVLKKHRQQGTVIGLKALTNGVKLIAPKAGGMDQSQDFNSKDPHTSTTATDQPACLAMGKWKS
tara:strand:+ start:410 stop:604 length:195 start_codon:yes stop_codon:yes gene_type:complete